MIIGAIQITILRRTRVSDGAGGWTEGFASMITVGGRVRPVSGRERELAARLSQDISHVAYVGAGIDVRAGDRLKVHGIDMDVLAVTEPGFAGRYLTVECKQVDVPGMVNAIHPAGGIPVPPV